MTRWCAIWAMLGAFPVCVSAQKPVPPPQQQEQEPPEEDPGLKAKEYSFNPLQAQKELRVGNYYFKKGSYKAAASRFRESTKWDPTNAEAFFRLGESEEKLRDRKASREAFEKYLELAPDGKEAAVAKRKLAAK